MKTLGFDNLSDEHKSILDCVKTDDTSPATLVKTVESLSKRIEELEQELAEARKKPGR